jgi:hypothetical protein
MGCIISCIHPSTINKKPLLQDSPPVSTTSSMDFDLERNTLVHSWLVDTTTLDGWKIWEYKRDSVDSGLIPSQQPPRFGSESVEYEL